jgi:hypothetical protein
VSSPVWTGTLQYAWSSWLRTSGLCKKCDCDIWLLLFEGRGTFLRTRSKIASQWDIFTNRMTVRENTKFEALGFKSGARPLSKPLVLDEPNSLRKLHCTNNDSGVKSSRWWREVCQAIRPVLMESLPYMAKGPLSASSFWVFMSIASWKPMGQLVNVTASTECI